jgi:hypothetical protein
MKRKNILLVLGVFLAVFLMISASTAVSAVTSKVLADNKKEGKYDVFIENNIQLNRHHLPALKKSFDRVSDSDIKFLLEMIIEGIENKGFVDSFDLKTYVEHYDLSNSLKGIHSGMISGKTPCIDSYILLPGLIRVLVMGIISMVGDWFRLFGYSTFVYWESLNRDYCGPIYVNGHSYSKGHTGFVVGFVGFAQHYHDSWGSHHIPDGPAFRIKGIGALIIIS